VIETIDPLHTYKDLNKNCSYWLIKMPENEPARNPPLKNDGVIIMVPIIGKEKVKISSVQRQCKLASIAFAILFVVPSVAIQADDSSGKAYLNDLTPEVSEKKADQSKSDSEPVDKKASFGLSSALSERSNTKLKNSLKKSIVSGNQGTSPGQLWIQNSVIKNSSDSFYGLGSPALFPSPIQEKPQESITEEDVEQILQVLKSHKTPKLKPAPKLSLKSVPKSSKQSVPKLSNQMIDEIFSSQSEKLALTAYQNEEVPKLPPADEVPELPNANQQPVTKPSSDNSPQKAASGRSSSSGSTTGGTSYGEAPADRSFDFLRRVSPLLKPGEYQFDIGFAYTLFENDLPVYLDGVPDPDFVTEGRLRLRQMFVPFALRYGLTDRVQLFVNAPVGWSNAEFSFPGFDIFDDVGGIGDISGGATVLLSEKDACHPNKSDLIGTLAFTAPTGNDAFSTVVQIPNAQLGSGHWAVSANLLSIKTIDPLVIFHGGGIRYQFAEDRGPNNSRVEPGLEFNYQFGVGFAVNEKVTMSTSLLGAYITELELAGQSLPHSSLEPVRLRFALTMARPKQRILEPFVEFGLTDDANSFNLGWTLTFK
jgi:Putative MetA-pathway of phenol degradation